MAKTKEEWDEEHSDKKAWSVEELTEKPKSARRLNVWIEDRYVITEAAEGMRQKVKDNNNFCPKNKNLRCMCDDFYNFDGEIECACGVYKKTLRDEDFFIRMRRHSFRRGD